MATVLDVLQTFQLKNKDPVNLTLAPLSLDCPRTEIAQQNDSSSSAQKNEETLSKTAALFSSSGPLSSQSTSLPKPATIGFKRRNNGSIEGNVTDKPTSCRLLFPSETGRNQKLEQEVQSYSSKRLKSPHISNRDLLPSRFTFPLSRGSSPQPRCHTCIMAQDALHQGDLFSWCYQADALTQAIKAYSNGIKYLSKTENPLYDNTLYCDLTLRLANTYMARANTLNAEINDKKFAYFYYEEYLKCEAVLRPYSRRPQNPHMIEALRHLLNVRTFDKEEFKQKT